MHKLQMLRLNTYISYPVKDHMRTLILLFARTKAA